jgi:hypothetical protein
MAKQKLPFELRKKTSLKEAQSAFGLASHPYKVELKPGHDELLQVEIPLDLKICAKRQVNLATVRVFRWDESAKRFLLVEGSRVSRHCIKQAIIWRDPAPRSYTAWTASEQADLADAFNTIRSGGEVALPETVPATAPSPGALLSRLRMEDAWQAYIAHLAQTLVVESCGWVDWSLPAPGPSLRLLLDSDEMFTATADGYEMQQDIHGRASHGDPTRVYRWLRDENLIASDQLTTVGRVLEWCRDNMKHYWNDATPDNMEDHWQYRGYPPVERIIAGTTYTPLGWNAHWTAGCRGTSGFLRLVLRTINVPATLVINCGHAQPYFPTLGAYLSHGDDPYASNTRDAG